jgi:hypothetical protein
MTVVFISDMPFFYEKYLGPLLCETYCNLALHEKSSASAWIFGIEFKKYIFLGFPGQYTL